MSNDMRSIKFETFIKDVDKAIDTILDGLSFRSSLAIFKGVNPSKRCNNPSLLLIYDYDQLNDYGKIILKHSNLYLSDWDSEYLSVDSLKDNRAKIDAAKDLVRYLRMDEHKLKGYRFIFWAMMILTVDKRNQEEALSLICDFAKILKISDDEMMDILHVIKYLYYPEMREATFKSDTIPACFSKVMNLYN